MPEDKKIERQTILIKEVGTPTPVEGKNFQRLQFKGSVGVVTHNYSTINQSFFPLIYESKDKSLDCDVQITQGTDVTYYSVVQIYKDGKPVSEKKWSGKSYGKSPEELAIERRSIERQTSLKLAVEYCANLSVKSDTFISIEEKTSTILDVAEKFYQWISTGGSAPLTTSKKAPETPKQASGQPKQNTSPPVTKVESSEVAFDELKSEGSPKLPEFKTADEMLRFACNKMEMTKLGLVPWTWAKIQETMKIKAPIDITDLEAAKKVLFAKDIK